MGKTRSMNRKKKYDDACIKNTIKKTCGVGPWSDLNHDVLFSVMMRLGVVDFLAFSGVCKSWRSVALSDRNMFMVSKPPMSIFTSTDATKDVAELFLDDFEGRKVKIALPQFAGRSCVGVTCGYLILIGEETDDFWLVNLITRHELHFPDVPHGVVFPHYCFRGTLVFSLSVSGWVFFVLTTYDSKLWFSIAGKRKWSEVSTPFFAYGLHVFKGTMYTLHSIRGSDEVRLCEMRLSPEPKVVLLETENILKINFGSVRFLASGEHLYVIDLGSQGETLFKIHELDFGKMIWVSREIGEKYAFFYSYLSYDEDYVLLQEVWADIHSQFRRFARIDERVKGRVFLARMWYFFHDCLNVNHIQ